MVAAPAGRWERWALPETVGAWGDHETFAAQRPESGQWVFWEDRAQLVLEGRYHEVRPLHVELSPTYLCNFACPWCSCRSAREEWAEEDVFSHPRASPLTVMHDQRLDSVVDHLAEHGIEIMWVGGEPTMNPLLYPAATRAHRRGLAQCIFTNGSLFVGERARILFEAELVFVRVSLNAVTPEVHQRHHDYDPRRPYGRRVLENLDRLAALRAERISRTLLGVSVVVDRHNVEDLVPTARFLAELCDRHGHGAIDYLVVRTAFPFHSARVDLSDDTAARFAEYVQPGSELRETLRQAGVDVVLPNEQRVAEPMPEDDEGCLAAGWFGEVTPSGDMLPCSDRYGDPEYYIGNIEASTLSEIYQGEQRRRVLEKARVERCHATYCPAGGRGNMLNRRFREVEALRRAGQIDRVARWMEELRQLLPRPTHSFFL